MPEQKMNTLWISSPQLQMVRHEHIDQSHLSMPWNAVGGDRERECAVTVAACYIAIQ